MYICICIMYYAAAAAAATKLLQSCPTLCDPMDSSPPGSSIPGILQARTLEIMYYMHIINILLIFYCSIKFQILEFYKRMMAFSEC